MLTDGIAYEVTVERFDRHRDRFAEWFPTVVLDWTTQPEVRAFRIYHGVDRRGERLRLVFTFASETAWERFVQRRAHRERIARLETVASVVRTALWTPGAVRLLGDGPTIVGIDESDSDESACDDQDSDVASPDAVVGVDVGDEDATSVADEPEFDD